MYVVYTIGDEQYEIRESDSRLQLVPEIAVNGERTDITLHVTNCSADNIRLEYAVLWQIYSEAELDIGGGPYQVYRSGKHKNDMPGTFVLRQMDERLTDVMGAMTESGDKTDAQDGVGCVISDHLTVFQGAQKSLLVLFGGGRNQLFETRIDLDERAGLKAVSAKAIWNKVILPGQCVQTETLSLVRTCDAEEAVERFAEEKALCYGSRSGARPSVFCTWYYYGLTVSYEDVKTNLEIMQQRKLPFDVFQVDEGWEITLGEWQPNAKFPVSMKQVAEEIKQAGYRPGIWTSPFVAHETASIWKEHPEWKLCDRAGQPYLFPMNDTVYQVIDITNPSTYDYFRELYHTLTYDWGYTYHKLDFTRAAVIYEEADFYDPTVTLAEAYYKAVRAIREGMGEDSYFLMCGGLYDPIIGLVDAQRTGSDVLSMWSSNINKGGKTAPYTIKQSSMRYYMNRWWDNDPDALMIRKNETMERNLRLTYGLLNDEEVKTSVLNQFMGGGIMCATEPLDKISDERLMEYRRILPVVPSAVRPVRLMEETRFPGMTDVYLTEEDSHVLCVINWEDEEYKEVVLCIGELLPGYAGEEDRYIICDYYNGTYIAEVSANEKIVCAPIAPHGAGVYKVIRMREEPVVVISTGHYAMSGRHIMLEMKNNKLYYRIQNDFDCPIDYTVLLPQGREVVLHIEKGVYEGFV